MVARPASYIGWVPGGEGAYIQQPTSGQKTTGWVAGEGPPFDWMNWLFYTLDQWTQYLNGVASFNGGGGGSSQWNEPDGIAPVRAEENAERVYLFPAASSSELVMWVRVPASYVVGSQLTMTLGYYTPSTAGTTLLTVTAYLIQNLVNAVSSTTNSHVSANTAQAASATANVFRTASLDLTDSVGKVNGVAVSPGDSLRLILTRGTDTDTGSIRFIPSMTGVLFA